MLVKSIVTANTSAAISWGIVVEDLTQSLLWITKPHSIIIQDVAWFVNIEDEFDQSVEHDFITDWI